MQVRIPQEVFVPFPTICSVSFTAPARTSWKALLSACPCRHGPCCALYCHRRAHLQSIALRLLRLAKRTS